VTKAEAKKRLLGFLINQLDQDDAKRSEIARATTSRMKNDEAIVKSEARRSKKGGVYGAARPKNPQKPRSG
jgi:hypothetical protein